MSARNAESTGRPAVDLIDRRVDALAGRLRGDPVADRVFYTLSQAANHSVLWHGINALDALIGGPDHRRRALRRSVVLGVEQALVNGGVKQLVDRARPETVTDHPHALRRPVTSSFPSGHASAGACAATLLTADLGLGFVWYPLAALIAWSRVHVGVHHASDLIGGAVVGRNLARLAGRLWPTH